MCDSACMMPVYIRENKTQALRAEKSHKHSAHQTTVLQNSFSCLNGVGLFSPTTLIERIFLCALLCQVKNRSMRKNNGHETLQLYIFTKIFPLLIALMVRFIYIYVIFFFPYRKQAHFRSHKTKIQKLNFPLEFSFHGAFCQGHVDKTVEQNSAVLLQSYKHNKQQSKGQKKQTKRPEKH